MGGPERHAFHVEADADVDVLLRIIGPFAVQGAALGEVRHAQTPAGAWTVIEASGLDADGAEQLRLRLARLPAVRSVRMSTGLTLIDAAK